MTRPGTIAVTGAAGMLGLNLVAFFYARSWTVRAFERQPDPDDADDADSGDEPRLTAHRADLPDHLDEAALAGVDVLVHTAWTTRAVDADTARRTNDLGTKRLVQAARAAGVGRLIFISTTSAQAAALSEYGRSKHAAEALFDGKHDLVIRAGLILSELGGLFQRLRLSIERSSVVPLFGGGRQIIQTIHVDDFCAALERAIENDVTGRITLAEPDGLAFRDFLAEIATRVGKRNVRVPLPYAPALLALKTTEALGLRLPISSENLRGLKTMCHVPSRDDLERLGIKVRSTRESLDDLLGSAD